MHARKARTHTSAAVTCGATRKANKTTYITGDEENGAKKTTMFTPVDLHDDQVGDDNVRWTLSTVGTRHLVEVEVLQALWRFSLAGVSVGRVEDITQTLWSTPVSSGAVSRLNVTSEDLEIWADLIEGRPGIAYEAGYERTLNTGEYCLAALHPFPGIEFPWTRFWVKVMARVSDAKKERAD